MYPLTTLNACSTLSCLESEARPQGRQGEERRERAVGCVRLVVLSVIEVRPAAGAALDLLRAAAHVLVPASEARAARVPNHLPLQVFEELVALHRVVQEKLERILRLLHGNRYVERCARAYSRGTTEVLRVRPVRSRTFQFVTQFRYREFRTSKRTF